MGAALCGANVTLAMPIATAAVPGLDDRDLPGRDFPADGPPSGEEE